MTGRVAPDVVGADDPESLVGALMAPPFPSDPYPVASRLRELAPMFRSELGLWYASDFASCQDVFRSPNVGQGFNTTRIEQDPRFEHSDSLKMFGRMIPFMDPPDHTRIRQILAPYFTPRAIEASRPYTQALVDRLLDDMAAKGGGDLVADFAENVPVAVMCQLLGGMGDTDQAQCRDWADGLVEAVHPVCTEEMMRHADDAAVGFSEYFRALIAAGDGDGDDLMGRLITARAERHARRGRVPRHRDHARRRGVPQHPQPHRDGDLHDAAAPRRSSRSCAPTRRSRVPRTKRCCATSRRCR